jgi:hypothetical protein
MSQRIYLTDDAMRELVAAVLVPARPRCHGCGRDCPAWYCATCRPLARRTRWDVVSLLAVCVLAGLVLIAVAGARLAGVS